MNDSELGTHRTFHYLNPRFSFCSNEFGILVKEKVTAWPAKSTNEVVCIHSWKRISFFHQINKILWRSGESGFSSFCQPTRSYHRRVLIFFFFYPAFQLTSFIVFYPACFFSLAFQTNETLIENSKRGRIGCGLRARLTRAFQHRLRMFSILSVWCRQARQWICTNNLKFNCSCSRFESLVERVLWIESKGLDIVGVHRLHHDPNIQSHILRQSFRNIQSVNLRQRQRWETGSQSAISQDKKWPAVSWTDRNKYK